ncbi:MAG: glycosyltransferase [Desulfobacterales bacterium]|nr:glycosyltransferase [Desulfobacterales bacterium]
MNKHQAKDERSLPRVGVVIPARNEAVRIEACIASVQAQTYPAEKVRIIVIDNASTDRTVALAVDLGVEMDQCGPERSAQRNFGSRLADDCRYLLFLDADMRLSRGVIRACVQACETDGHVGLYIPEKITGRRLWAGWRTFERSFYDGTCIDGVRFIRRRTFRAINGFDESLTSAEDWDLTRRLAGQGSMALVDPELYHDESGVTLGRYLRKKGFYADVSHRYIAKWGRRDPLVRRQFGLYYRYWGVFSENGNWRRVVRRPLHFACVLIVKGLVGLMFLVTLGRRQFFTAVAGGAR